MAVTHTDSCHARKQVQVSLPINIPQPLHVALVNEHRVFVGGSFHYHGVAVLSADLQHSLFRHTLNNTCQTGKVSLCHQCVCVCGGGIHTHMYWINDTGRPCIPLVWSCTAACLGCLCLSSQVTVSDMLDLLLIFDEYSSGKFHQEHIQLAFKYVTFKRYNSSTHAHFAAVLFLNVFRDNGKWKRQSISSMSVFSLFVSQWSICNDYL